jgi:hypothetical protein
MNRKLKPVNSTQLSTRRLFHSLLSLQTTHSIQPTPPISPIPPISPTPSVQLIPPIPSVQPIPPISPIHSISSYSPYTTKLISSLPTQTIYSSYSSPVQPVYPSQCSSPRSDVSNHSFSCPETNSILSPLKRYCKIINKSGTTFYLHITDDPNRLLLSNIGGGVNGSVIGMGMSAELTFNKSVQIKQTTRILNGETIVINLSTNKNRYLTAAWQDKQHIYWLRCISTELDRGHVYTMDVNDLKDPIGYTKIFIP